MPSLAHWEAKIQAVQKQKTFAEYAKYVTSWMPFVLTKNRWRVSRYPESTRLPILVEPLEYEEIRSDFLKNPPQTHVDGDFFENVKTILQTVPLSRVVHFPPAENAEYADVAVHVRNAYLGIAVGMTGENIFYSFNILSNTYNILNTVLAWDRCDNIYWCVGIIRSVNIYYSRYILDSANIWFSTNLIGCRECLFCDWLENKQYCIENKQYEKEEYLHKKQELLSRKTEFLSWYRSLTKVGKNFGSTNIQWSFCIECMDIEKGFFNYRLKSGTNLLLSWSEEWSEEAYNGYILWTIEHFYWSGWSGKSEHGYMCYNISYSSNIFYSTFLDHCSFCLGCSGLKNQSYCIFNKQYTKEDWHKTVDKIFEKMQTNGTLWHFLPPAINPFFYNDTIAQTLHPLTKEHAIHEWFLWRDHENTIDIPDNTEITDITSIDIADTNNDDILTKVLRDRDGKIYRIIEPELAFLRKHELPIPEIHWETRLREHVG